jgi:hypothetical protein
VGAQTTALPPELKKDARDAVWAPLHLYLEKLIEGEPNSVEVLFAPEQAFLSAPHPLWLELLKAREAFVSKNVKRYAYFAYDQASRYGLAPKRYEAAAATMLFLQDLAPKATKATRLRDFQPELEAFIAGNPTMELEIVGIMGGMFGTLVPHFRVSGKAMPMGVPFQEALSRMKAAVREYGQRTRAKAEDGCDWKALSTALRITWEAIELMKTKKIVFPLEGADYIRAVKQGLIEQDVVVADIQAGLDLLPDLAAASDLAETIDPMIAEELLIRAHSHVLKPLLAA